MSYCNFFLLQRSQILLWILRLNAMIVTTRIVPPWSPEKKKKNNKPSHNFTPTVLPSWQKEIILLTDTKLDSFAAPRCPHKWLPVANQNTWGNRWFLATVQNLLFIVLGFSAIESNEPSPHPKWVGCPRAGSQATGRGTQLETARWAWVWNEFSSPPELWSWACWNPDSSYLALGVYLIHLAVEFPKREGNSSNMVAISSLQYVSQASAFFPVQETALLREAPKSRQGEFLPNCTMLSTLSKVKRPLDKRTSKSPWELMAWKHMKEPALEWKAATKGFD